MTLTSIYFQIVVVKLFKKNLKITNYKFKIFMPIILGRVVSMSHVKALNNKGPKVELSGTPNSVSLHELYLSFILTLSFLFVR